MHNARLLTAFAALRMTLFPIPIITLFWKDQIGLTLTSIMVLQAIFSLTVVVVEFPSGYLADRIGYRRALQLGAALVCGGWLLYTQASTFSAVVLAEVALGCGVAFTSGSDSALLFGSLQRAGQSASYVRWEGRARSAGQFAEALSSAVGGWLYSVAPRFPFVLQVPTWLAAWWVACTLGELPRNPAKRKASHVRHALFLVGTSLWSHRRLATTLMLSVTLGLTTFLMVWMIQPYMQKAGVPEAWFGVLWAGFHVWLAAMSLLSHRLERALGTGAVLGGCCALAALGYALLWSIEAWYGFVAYLALMTVRGVSGPILVHALQQDSPDDDRASVLSLGSLLFRLGFVVVGPPVGWLIDRRGLDDALVVVGVATTLAATAAWLAFTRARRHPAPAA